MKKALLNKKAQKATADKQGELVELKQFGARLKELRKAKGYTSHETFAYDHDFTRSQINKYERGGDIRLSSLVKILKALDITLSEFFNEGFD